MLPQATEGRNPVRTQVGFMLRFKIAQFNVYMWVSNPPSMANED